MTDNAFWLGVWTIIAVSTVAIAMTIVSGQIRQMKTMTEAGYCERFQSSTWVRCELLESVTIK